MRRAIQVFEGDGDDPREAPQHFEQRHHDKNIERMAKWMDEMGYHLFSKTLRLMLKSDWDESPANLDLFEASVHDIVRRNKCTRSFRAMLLSLKRLVEYRRSRIL